MSTPRTPDRPFAFTAGELHRGAFFAWVVFVVLVAFSAAMLEALRTEGDFRVGLGGAPPTRMGAVLSSALGFGIAAAVLGGVVALIGLPLAHSIGTKLSTVSSIQEHILAYSGLGGGIGMLWLLLAAVMLPWLFANAALVIIIAVAAAVSVPTGWLLTVCAALRRDRREGGRPQETAT